MFRGLWTFVACAAVACSGSPDPKPDAGPDHPDASAHDAGLPDASLPDGGRRCDFFGDPDQAPALTPLLWQFDGGYQPLSDEGQAAPLWAAGQGGHVMLVGARIFNLDGCNATLSARIRSAEDGGLFGFETRSVDFRFHDGDGGVPELQFWNVANVPLCPNFDSHAIQDRPWTLEVEVKDFTGRTASIQQTVVPSCDYDDEQSRYLCNCECEPGYFFGKCSWPPVDGGP